MHSWGWLWKGDGSSSLHYVQSRHILPGFSLLFCPFWVLSWRSKPQCCVFGLGKLPQSYLCQVPGLGRSQKERLSFGFHMINLGSRPDSPIAQITVRSLRNESTQRTAEKCHMKTLYQLKFFLNDFWWLDQDVVLTIMLLSGCVHIPLHNATKCYCQYPSDLNQPYFLSKSCISVNVL